MKKNNIGKMHWAAILFWIAALIDSFFGNNNFNLFFSFYLLVIACIFWYIFISENMVRIQRSIYAAGYRSLLILLSLVIMLISYHILFVRLELMNALIAVWIGNIAMAIAAILTYHEVKRSTN